MNLAGAIGQPAARSREPGSKDIRGLAPHPTEFPLHDLEGVRG